MVEFLAYFIAAYVVTLLVALPPYLVGLYAIQQMGRLR